MWRTLPFVLVLWSSCGGAPRAVKPPPPTLTDPGSVLIAQESSVWMLEGLLVAEADAALRSPGARKELGDPMALARQADGEPRVRAWLRAHRSAEARRLAVRFLEVLDAPTRKVLTETGKAGGLAPAEVFMDYLCYEGLYDLALMRVGWKRWKAGRFAGAADTDALARSFFGDAKDMPSAGNGIRVMAADGSAIDISVFGGRVRERIERSKVEKGRQRRGVVDWSSNYEGLRRMQRGERQAATYREILDWDGAAFRVSYAAELDEYLAWGAATPWAAILYALPADEVADLLAGAAAAGGLEAGTRQSGDPAALPLEGAIGGGADGIAVTVREARFVPTLAGTGPRRGRFVIVVVSVRSKRAEPVRVPATWFTLAAADAEYPEIGVARPHLSPALMALSPGADPLAIPYTMLEPDQPRTLVLVYDVPAAVDAGALVVSEELALRVAPSAPEPPSARLAEKAVATEVRAAAAGRIEWMARPGTRVSRGQPVARLAGGGAAQKRLARARARLAAYEKQRDRAEAAHDRRKAASAARKVADKQRELAEAQRSVSALVLIAPGDGGVAPVVRRGRIKAGQLVARIEARSLAATFVTPLTRDFSAGSACRLARRDDRDRRYACVVDVAAGTRLEVRVVDAGLAAGDTVALIGEGEPR